MHRIVKALALTTLSLLVTAASHAEAAKTIATLNCAGGDSPALKLNVYAYNFDTGINTSSYFSVYLSNAAFEPMEIDQYVYSGWGSCFLSSNKGTVAMSPQIQEVDSVGVGVDVDGGSLTEDSINQQYTVVYFSYNGLYVGPNVLKAGKAGTPEQQAAAFAAFKAKTALSLPRH